MNAVLKCALWSILLFTVLCGNQSVLSQSMFHGDSLHTGYYATKELKQSPQIKWQFKTNGRIFSSPILWNKTIYIGSGDSCLYAIDVASGTQRWKFRTQGVINSTPTVSDGTIYFGSYDGLFYALNAATGDLRWTFATKGEQHFRMQGLFGYKPTTMMMDDVFDFFCSSPIVYDGKIYFGSGDSTFYALDSHTGTLQWSFKTEGVIHSSPVSCDGKILFGSWDRNMYCVDAETGKEIWRFTTGADPKWQMAGIIASPTVYQDRVYFGARDANFYSLDLSTGTKQWSVSNSGAWVLASAAIKDSTVYYGTSDNTLLFALNTRTKKALFNINTSTYEYSSPALTDSVIYFGTFSGYLCAYNRYTGKELWKFQTQASKQNSSAVLLANGRIDWNSLCPGMDLYQYSTTLYGMDRLMTLGCIVSSPLVDDGVVYFGSADSCVYALVSSPTNNVKEDQGLKVPSQIPLEVRPNFPNPFNPNTEISYRINESGFVTMKIYDTLGREVKTVINEYKAPGFYKVTWDGKNREGSCLSSGVYYCTVCSGSAQKSIKMLLMQ